MMMALFDEAYIQDAYGRERQMEGEKKGRMEGELIGERRGKMEGRMEGIMEGFIEGFIEGIMEGIMEGKREERIRIILGMKEAELPDELIAKAMKISLSEVREILQAQTPQTN